MMSMHSQGAKMANKITPTDTGLRIRSSYHTVIRLVMTGVLEGGKDEHGRWYVNEESVGRYLERELRARKAANVERPATTTA
jgi:predicted site-specific integrase-resolvase